MNKITDGQLAFISAIGLLFLLTVPPSLYKLLYGIDVSPFNFLEQPVLGGDQNPVLKNGYLDK